MLNRTIMCGALVAPWLMLSPALADCGRGAHASPNQISASDLEALSDWTSRRAGLRPAKELPNLESRSPAELAALRHGTATADNGTDLIALYDSESRTILLSTGWRDDGAAARSVIVHEMVHHLQHENGMRFACAAEQEEQAFAIQEAWLAEHGSSLEKEFGIDPFTRMAASLCLY